jgi:CheY-like chemotaxis protein
MVYVYPLIGSRFEPFRATGKMEGFPVGQSHSVLSLVRGCLSRAGTKPPRAVSALVVDDEPSVRRFVNRVLESAGYRTAMACDGVEALQVAEGLEALDLVVCDLAMPNMTGVDFGRRLRQSRPNIKILYLTGFSDHLFKERTVLWEDEAYLDKPCSPKGLLQAVSLLLFRTVDAPELKAPVGEGSNP